MFTTPHWQEVFVWLASQVNTVCMCWGLVEGERVCLSKHLQAALQTSLSYQMEQYAL